MTKRITLGILLALLAYPLFGLNHRAEATLWQHLVEVNVQWELQVNDPSPYGVQVQFASEAERIRSHLLLVEGLLRQRQHPGMSAEIRSQRLAMLDALHAYALGGIFPQNTYLPQRIPCFIDEAGTACAVGHLLIESGHGEFARRIRSEMNHAYIRDMNYPQLPRWAAEHGFTLDELAWIQPGYPHGETWTSPAGTDVNGPVTFLKTLPTGGNLLVAGDFSLAGGQAVDNIFILTAAGQVIPMGSGFEGQVHALVEFENNLWLGGAFTSNGGANIAVYDPVFETWTFQQVYTGTVYDLEVISGKLYAGGDLQHSGGALVQHILEYNQGGWSSVGMGFDAPVHSLAKLGGDLYAGGEFLASGQTATPYVARWDGTAWQAAGARNLGSPVRVLEGDGADLWAGGDILQSDLVTPAFGLARLVNGDWEVMGDTAPIPAVISPMDPGQPYIDALAFHNGELYAEGDFFLAPTFVGNFGNDLGRIDSTGRLVSILTLDSSASVQAMAIWEQRLLVGGILPAINGQATQNLAERALANSVAEVLLPLQVELYPNPASDHILLTLPSERDWKGLDLKLRGMDGRELEIAWTLSGRTARLALDAIPPGIYLISLENQKRQQSAGQIMVKQ